MACRLEPGGSVQHVAHQIGVAVARHQFTGVDADPQAQLDAVLVAHAVGEPTESALQLQPGSDRPEGVVLGDLGQTEDRHHPVAGELDDGAGVILDRRSQDLEVRRQRRASRLGVDAFPERRRPDEIAEQRSHVLADSVGDWSPLLGAGIRRRRRGDRRPALVAELRTRRLLGLARSTPAHQGRATLTAELGVCFVVVTASAASQVGHPPRSIVA